MPRIQAGHDGNLGQRQIIATAALAQGSRTHHHRIILYVPEFEFLELERA